MTDAKPDRDADDYLQDIFGNPYMLIDHVLRVEVAYLGQHADLVPLAGPGVLHPQRVTSN